VIQSFTQLTMQIRGFLKAIPQLVSVVLYVHVMASFGKMEWETFRKVKGEFEIENFMYDELANQL
jgi:hypothetical protein